MKYNKNHLPRAVTICIVIVLSAFTTHAQTDSLSTPGKEIYTYVEQMPEFEGGEKALMQFIGSNIKYSNGQPEGTVLLSFVIDKTGSVTDLQIANGLDPVLDQECIRVLKATEGKWKPGLQKGEAVAVRYFVPLRFSQPEKPANNATNFDSMPEYKQGTLALLKFISKNVKYPKGANKRGVVEVSFIVNEDGSLSEYEVVKSLEPTLDQEAIRVIKLTDRKWNPGIQNGRSVKVRYSLLVELNEI